MDSPSHHQAQRAVTLEERQKIHDNLKGIFEKTARMNPVYPAIMSSSLDFIERGEIGLAIDFFFQDVFNPDDWLVDVSLHDLIYVLYVSRLLGVREVTLDQFQVLERYVVDLYG